MHGARPYPSVPGPADSRADTSVRRGPASVACFVLHYYPVSIMTSASPTPAEDPAPSPPPASGAQGNGNQWHQRTPSTGSRPGLASNGGDDQASSPWRGPSSCAWACDPGASSCWVRCDVFNSFGTSRLLGMRMHRHGRATPRWSRTALKPRSLRKQAFMPLLKCWLAQPMIHLLLRWWANTTQVLMWIPSLLKFVCF